MYETTFDPDWTDIDLEEAYERAYAIGVAATLGADLVDEYRRIHDHVATAYAKSLVELAYEEGVNEARELATGTDDETEVWDRLVAADGIVPPSPSHRLDVPAGMRPYDRFRRPGDRFEGIELPDFLTRR